MGLLISLVALLFVIFCPIYCLAAYLPDLLCRVPMRKEARNKRRHELILFAAGELCLIGIMMESFWIGNASNRAFAESMQSRENLKEISTVLIQYSEDWDGRLPPASRWQDVISQPPYFTAKHAGHVFTCPPDTVPCGYAINAAVAGKKIDDIKDPPHTVLVFETRSPGRNASGSAGDLAPSRHEGLLFPLGFCDGYAKKMNASNPDFVLWSPKQRVPGDDTP